MLASTANLFLPKDMGHIYYGSDVLDWNENLFTNIMLCMSFHISSEISTFFEPTGHLIPVFLWLQTKWYLKDHTMSHSVWFLFCFIIKEVNSSRLQL